MATIAKDFPVRVSALCFSSENRASRAATSPARTECFDIFSPEPGDTDVTSQIERLSSKEMKMAGKIGLDSGRRLGSVSYARHGRLQSGWFGNLTLPERRLLSISP
jgi:hypothetical protein